MAKVAQMIGDFAPAAGEAGRGIDHEVASRLAGEMRQILNRDLEEADIALEVYLYHLTLDQDEYIAAWEHLNAMERRGWRIYCGMGKIRDAHPG